MFRNRDRGVLLPSASAETCASLRRRMLTLSPRRRTLANLTTRFHGRCDRSRGTRLARRYPLPAPTGGVFPRGWGDRRDRRPTGKFPSAPWERVVVDYFSLFFSFAQVALSRASFIIYFWYHVIMCFQRLRREYYGSLNKIMTLCFSFSLLLFSHRYFV